MCSPSAIWMKLAHYDPTSIIKLWNSTCIFSKWCQMGRDPLAARASKRYISTDSLRFHIRVLWTLPDAHTHTQTHMLKFELRAWESLREVLLCTRTKRHRARRNWGRTIGKNEGARFYHSNQVVIVIIVIFVVFIWITLFWAYKISSLNHIKIIHIILFLFKMLLLFSGSVIHFFLWLLLFFKCIWFVVTWIARRDLNLICSGIRCVAISIINFFLLRFLLLHSIFFLLSRYIILAANVLERMCTICLLFCVCKMQPKIVIAIFFAEVESKNNIIHRHHQHHHHYR